MKSPRELVQVRKTKHLALRQSNIKGQGQNEGCERKLGVNHQRLWMETRRRGCPGSQVCE